MYEKDRCQRNGYSSYGFWKKDGRIFQPRITMILNLIIIRTMLCNIFRANRGYFSFFSCQGHLQSSNISIHDGLLSIFEGKLTSVLRSNLEYIYLASFELSLFSLQNCWFFHFHLFSLFLLLCQILSSLPFHFFKSLGLQRLMWLGCCYCRWTVGPVVVVTRLLLFLLLMFPRLSREETRLNTPLHGTHFGSNTPATYRNVISILKLKSESHKGSAMGMIMVNTY